MFQSGLSDGIDVGCMRTCRLHCPGNPALPPFPILQLHWRQALPSEVIRKCLTDSGTHRDDHPQPHGTKNEPKTQSVESTRCALNCGSADRA